MVTERALILCVDDEPQVLEGLALVLRRHAVLKATSGEAALEVLGRERGVAVVMSDMRMPGMDGATFLGKARALLPDATRLLLTGHTDLDAAIHAVNEGGIFRFLTKPCLPHVLQAAIDAAVDQHRLITAERVLLEQTLQGSLQTLSDVLALANPLAFGRATRVRHLASELAVATGSRVKWQVEVAALLAPLGSITLSAETLEKTHHGKQLTEAEALAVRKVPEVSARLVGPIPRLELVRDILAEVASDRPWSMPPAGNARAAAMIEGACLLRVAADFDQLEAQGMEPRRAIEVLIGRVPRYERRVVDALASLQVVAAVRADVRELPVSELRAGMRLVEDLHLASGALLVGKGYDITPSFLERVRHFPTGAVREPVRVQLGR